VTLNLVLATKEAIHLASDFRLSTQDKAGGRIVLSDHSPKLVAIVEDNFQAVVTYCGVGSFAPSDSYVDTYMYIKEWITQSYRPDLIFAQLLELIKQGATVWMEEIRRLHKSNHMHSFIVAGFEETRPMLGLVSNFETFEQQHAVDVFNVHRHTVIGNEFFIFGARTSVRRDDRRRLLSLAGMSVGSSQVRTSLAEVIAHAHEAPQSEGSVSRSCYAYTLNSNGYGQGMLYGDVDGEMTPVTLLKGRDLSGSLSLRAAPGKHLQIGSSAFAVGQQTADAASCELEVAYGSGSSAIKLIALACTDAFPSYANAINNHGLMVGECKLASGRALPCLWRDNEEGELLHVDSAFNWWPHDVNDHEQIVGTLCTPDGTHPFFWDREKGIIDLGTLGGVNAHAQAINNMACVIGPSWTIPGRSAGDKLERAFIWSLEQGMRDLGTSPSLSSRARDINDHNIVVGNTRIGFGGTAFVWTEDGGAKDLATLGGSWSQAASVNQFDCVVGTSADQDGHRKAFSWTEKDGLHVLPLAGEVVCINDKGQILFNKQTRAGGRAFVWIPDRGCVELPAFRGHDMRAHDMNNNGVIVGRAMKDNHSHAVVWNL
jgi:uncharacterized membrane protein